MLATPGMAMFKYSFHSENIGIHPGHFIASVASGPESKRAMMTRAIKETV